MRIIVTGGNSGDGKATATALACAGAPRGLFHHWGKPMPTKLGANARSRKLAQAVGAELTSCDWQEG